MVNDGLILVRLKLTRAVTFERYRAHPDIEEIFLLTRHTQIRHFQKYTITSKSVAKSMSIENFYIKAHDETYN